MAGKQDSTSADRAALTACIPYQRSTAAARGRWDHEADVVVVGSGAAALSGAVAAACGGVRVLVLEAGAEVGGTTARSGGGTWIPNNRYMREAGLEDPREDAIRYMAMYSFRQLYDPDDKYYGLSENAYRLLLAFYDNASPAIESLVGVGALMMRGDFSYDYWEDAPENKAPIGRTIFPTRPGDPEVMGDTHPATHATPAWREVNRTAGGGQIGSGGPLMIGQMTDWLRKHDASILLGHRAERLIVNSRGEVVGLEATRAEGADVTVRARRAIHFGSGGFSQNKDLRLSFLRGPAYGGCAVPTNRGDFLYMATNAGAQLGNMQNGWNTNLILDDAFDPSHPLRPILILAGDSMFVINKYGLRVGNEKRNYADRLEVQHDYDAKEREWRNLVLFIVFDQRALDLCAGVYPYPPPGEAAPYLLKSDTLQGLASVISQRLVKFAPNLGGFKLDRSFAANLETTTERFNRFARSGVDEDFGRGSVRYDLQWHARARGERCVAANDKPNKTLYPLSPHGPYYAVALVKGHADTNGGPVINDKAQVLSNRNQPIPGLYGAGNCIASPSGRAYWGGGTTIGLAMTFGYLAGKNAALDAVKSQD
jgi:3-oxosteroid 1-dehydrogenase